MPKKQSASNRRPAMGHRPWVHGAAYDYLSLPCVLHADVYAYVDKHDRELFIVIWSAGGTVGIAREVFIVNNEDELEKVQDTAAVPNMVQLVALNIERQLYWDTREHNMFRRVHPAMLSYVRGVRLPGFTRLSVLFHYIRVPDVSPWPRGFVNYYRPPAPDKTPRTGRPRKQRGASFGKLPNWL